MQCYTELTPPTAVTHSLSLPLTSAQSKNLVVAKSSLLQVFATKDVPVELGASQPDASSTVQAPYPVGIGNHHHNGDDGDDGLEASFLGGDAMLLRSDRSTAVKLVLVAEFPLAGTVTGLARIKIPGTKSGGEALLLAFKDARLSLVEWDPERHELSTISIHYYEQDELQGAPWAAPLSDYANFLVADPGSRCAALRFGARNLAILPFRQADDDEEGDIDMDDWNEELDGARPAKEEAATAAAAAATGPSFSSFSSSSSPKETPFAPSFVLRLSNLDALLLHPVHLAFLHEYREPTFGILSSQTAPSTVLGRRDSLSYLVFTLDLQQKASTTILSVSGLPQDLFRVFPVPSPIGGALLVGTNELIHIDQSGRANGVAVNAFTKQCTSFGLADQSALALRLEGCTLEMLSAETGEVLVVLHDGRLAVASIQLDGRTVSGLSMHVVSEEAGGDVILAGVSCLSRVGRQALFAGSEQSDSVVLGWSRKQQQQQGPASRKKTRGGGSGGGDGYFDDGDDGDEEEEAEEAEDEEEEMDDDDLYGDSGGGGGGGGGSGNKVGSRAAAAALAQGPAGGGGGAPVKGSVEDLTFTIDDQLLSIAPMRDMTFGKAAAAAASGEDHTLDRSAAIISSELDLVCAVGGGRGGALALLNREIQPEPVGTFAFPEARALWTVYASRPTPKALLGDKGVSAVTDEYESPAQHDRFLIVAKQDEDGFETSDVYAVTGTGFESLAGTEFEPAAGFTVQAGTMGQHKRIVQVLKSEVRCYDGDLGLSQILPMVDEDTGAEPRVLSASMTDRYLLLIRDDASAVVAELNKDLELEEMERDDEALVSTPWASGCLYQDALSVFGSQPEQIFLFLYSAAGAVHVYALPDLAKPVFVAEGLSCVPPLLSADFAVRRGTVKETITELLVADLGDTVAKTPYLLLRHDNDDLTLYEPVRADSSGTLAESLRFVKVPNGVFAKRPAAASTATDATEDEPAADEAREATAQPRGMPLQACGNIGGYSTVFLPGPSPSFVIKSAKSRPRVLRLRGTAVRSLSSFHTAGCERGFIYVDVEGTGRVAVLPRRSNLAELGVCVRKVALGADVCAVAYHAPTAVYVVGSSVPEAFELPKDEAAAGGGLASASTGVAAAQHRTATAAASENTPLKPVVERGRLQLISPASWAAIDTVELESCEVVMCVRTLNLEVSEATNERRPLVAVGTALARGEDLAVRGRVRVFDVVSVVPEPGRPETNRKLKRIAQEDIPRGAVTAVSEIGTQGLMLVAQGQKCLVRGLKEDGTLLPVAFMDMNCYVTAAKELPGTGLCVMADAFKGVWFTGYTEEPYRMLLFGKSNTRLETLNVDLLPDGKDLFIVAADADGNLHVLQFDPEHPKSLQGHLLLHRATFCTGAHYATLSLLLPSTSPQEDAGRDAAATVPAHHLLLASPTGQLASLAPLSESEYRRLSSLAGQLATSLAHTAGLNPKGYRMTAGFHAATMSPGVDAAVGRNVVDGALLARWAELASGRKAEMAGRVGYGSAPDVRAALEGVLGWSRMGYF